MKERLDVLLVKRGLAPSREKAKTMIMEGNVFVNNNREDKAGSTFAEDAPIEIHGNTLKYVSRGGLKLETGQRKCIPSMWDMASLHGNCARTQGLSVWKKQTSAMSHRKISMMCSILLRWMSHLFP